MASSSLLSRSGCTDPSPVTKDQYKEVVARFLRGVGFESPQYVTDTSLEQSITEHCIALANSQGLNPQRMPKIAKLAVAAAFWCYPYHSREIHKAIALYTAYFFFIEDLGQDFLEDNRRFRQNILLRKPQVPVLEAYTELLSSFDEHYEPYSADMICRGLFDFVSIAVFEFDLNGKIKVQPTAPHFPDYLRFKTGIPEPYIFFIMPKNVFPENHHLRQFIQAVPDLLYISNGTNDLLSFYKESIISTEQINFVHNFAASHGQSLYQTLESLADRLIKCTENARATVTGNPLLLKYIDGFISGNIAFHFQQPRYLLSELDLPE